MSGEVLALSLTLVVHLAGAAALIGLLLHTDGADWRSWWPRDDDDGPGPPEPDAPRPLGPGGDTAKPARARLRESGRLADAYPPHQRRPAREPEREREPAGR